MADFTGEDLAGARFERTGLRGAEFRASDLSGARFRGVDLSGVVMRGVELVGVDITGEIVDPLDLPWDEMPDTPGIPRDRAARPSLDTVLALRRDRMAMVRQVIDGLTDESLACHTEPVGAPGWPPPRSFAVRECLLIVLTEEWEHRRYAERDLPR
jgi:hypothetical protein